MDQKDRKTILITGATGVMGFATLKEFSRRLDRFKVRILARDSKKNRRLLRPYLRTQGIDVVWGDLLSPEEVARAVEGSDIVLHMGGLVSPQADRFPKKALAVNVGGTKNVVSAIKRLPYDRQPAMVYVGSVAQTSDRNEPYHWSRTGDPIMVAVFDYYGLSKVVAERIVVESGLRRWVSLRQSGILHAGLLSKSDDPIMFHVPLRGVLEWTTLEDSGRLMANICEDGVPDSFWNNFYNIGSGAAYRLTNYEFETLLLKAVGSPAPEKIFDTSWFATRNFHGSWFVDSERLESLVPFRANIPVEEYFRQMLRKAPKWVRLAPLAPARLVKKMMRKVAMSPELGTLEWLDRNDREQYIAAFFGSREAREAIPDWEGFDLSRPSDKPKLLDHGYDTDKADSELTIADMRKAAGFRGGRCLSDEMKPGDMEGKLEWECGFGHRFKATPRLILRGGHWCPRCLPAPWRYDEEARKNCFLAQVWHASHSPSENRVYDDGKNIGRDVSQACLD